MKTTMEGIERALEGKKHFFFDVDGTLVRSHALIDPSMLATLMELQKRGNTVTVVSGSNLAYIEKSIPDIWKKEYCNFSALPTHGNVAYDEEGRILWNRPLTWRQKLEIFQYISNVLEKAGFTYPDANDLVQDRGSQIAFSIYGHDAPLAEKEKVDPDLSKRKELLSKFPFRSETVEVKIGGTTNFDFIAKGFNKGRNIRDFITLPQYHWRPEECVYFGDRLQGGGNDDTVTGVIDTIPVKGPEDCERILREML